MDQAIRQQADALLARMSLRQKIGQMVQAERQAITPAEVKAWHIGSVLSGGGSCPGNNTLVDWVEMNDAYWQASMQEDAEHLAIPIIYGIDAVHGNNNIRGATIFPHNIGLGAARDPDLIERVAQVTAREILAAGVDWTFAPTLAVAQNYQWGRTYESYSQDPETVCSYAGRFVRGLQGDLGTDSVVACVKHWVGDGGTTHGIEQGDTEVSEEELRRIHMAPYLPALEAGVLSVMVSFNSWNGSKLHGHDYLVSQVLKQELGFAGCVISDWDGISYLSDEYAEAIALSVRAGIDMFMISEDWKLFIEILERHVHQGVVAQERVDDAVRRILSMKLAFGLFDKPRPSQRQWSLHPSYGSPEHREVAREAVRKSLVLLKNDDHILPLRKDQKVLVAGKNADNLGHQCGGFTVDWQGTSGNWAVEGGTSIWQGIRQLAPAASLSIDGSAANPQHHDVAVVVIGERPYAEGMGDIRSGEHLVVEAGSRIKGSLKTLEPYGRTPVLAELHPEDLETLKRVSATGLPVVALLVSGRPLITDGELAACDSFVAAWLPGSEGQGVAEVLFGDYPFTGQLSFAWPTAPDPEPVWPPEARFHRGYGLSA